MKKRISFGKVDGYGNGRKNCEIVLEFGYQEFEDQEPYFSVMANLYNHLHSDCIMGGQCIDTLYDKFKCLQNNELYTRILKVWKEWHLKPISKISDEGKEEINNIWLTI